MNIKNLIKTLGPGIIFASTAIGVSHLVQSTRAGAKFGFSLLFILILVNVLKFPFFEYASRYASVTGTSLIAGYKKIGQWMLILWFIINSISMIIATAVVVLVTAGFMDNLFHISDTFNSNLLLPVLLGLAICTFILISDRYYILDRLVKIIGILLVVSTSIAFILTLIKGPQGSMPMFSNNVLKIEHLGFIIAFMGWMPTPLDMATWSSLWMNERIKDSGYKPTLKETLFEFNLSYWMVTLLAVFFLTLGAYLIFGTGISMPSNSALFANRVITLYTETIGDWSYLIIASVGFSTMFGTSLGVIDGYARSTEETIKLLFFSKNGIVDQFNKTIYRIALLVTVLGGFFVIYLYYKNPLDLIDFVIITCFLMAPFLAIANFYLVMNSDFPKHAKPKLFLRILSWVGIGFLIGFSLLFIYNKWLY